MSSDVHTHKFTPSVELFASSSVPAATDDTPEDLPSYSKPNRDAVSFTNEIIFYPCVAIQARKTQT